MRFARDDMKGPDRFAPKRPGSFVSALRSIAGPRRPKINFCEIFDAVRFSTFATISARTEVGTFSASAKQARRESGGNHVSRSSYSGSALEPFLRVPVSLWDR